MKNKGLKLITSILMLTMLLSIMTGCSSTDKQSTTNEATTAQAGETTKEQTENQEIYTIKMGHNQPVESQFHAGAVKLAELAKEKSNGRLNIEVYHSAQLGDEGELAEGITIGTVDMALVATGSVTKYYPRYSMFDLPYLFRDAEHVDNVLQGEVGQMLADECEAEAGIKVMSYWESGFRHYLNNKVELHVPEDLAGLKIRTPEWPVLIAATETLGASATPMPFSELYMACQHGVVDGQEGPVFAIKSSKMYEVQDYMVLDGHTYTSMLLIMNPDKYNELPADLQKILSEVSREAGDYERQIIRDIEAEEIEFLETEGGLIIEKNPDKEVWRAAAAPVYDQFSDQFGVELIQKIIDTK